MDTSVFLITACLLILASAEFAKGPIDQKCLKCICEVESNCKRSTCAAGFGCGYFRLTESDWHDCGKPSKDWPTCANNLVCASGCVQLYVALYIYRCGHHSCQHVARTYSGGPDLCEHNSTLPYWRRVSACLQRS